MQNTCALLYCHLWPVWLYLIFRTVSHKGVIKKIIEHKMSVLIFSATFFWNISHSNKNSASFYACRSFCKLPVFLVRFLWNLNFLDIFFKKFSNIKVHEYPSSRNWVFLCRRTDRWTDMTRLIFTFCDFVNDPKDALFQKTEIPQHVILAV